MSNDLMTLTNFNTFNVPETSIYDSLLVKYTNKDFLKKFINVCIYQSDFNVAGLSNNTEVIKYFRGFLKDLSDDVKTSNSINIQQKPLNNMIHIIRKILDIREDSLGKLLTYDTVTKHFNTADIQCSKVLEDVKLNRIPNVQVFKSELEEITKNIQVYSEMKQVKLIFTEQDFLRSEMSKSDISPLNFLKDYKNHVINAYSQFSSLKSIMNEEDHEKYLEFYDETSLPKITENLFKYLSKSFNFYKSGYSLLDDNVDGIESGAVYIISAASNNGKSLYMVNLIRNMMLDVKNSFEPTDIILFITLEDDIYKVYRRFLSIFGNINTKIAKKLFVHCSSIIKESRDIDIKFKTVEQEINQLLEKITTKTIHTATKGRCRLGMIYSNESDFSMKDVEMFIDNKKAEGFNVKAVFIDYLDYMVPNNQMVKDKEGSEYSAHGQIVKEMKLTAREYGVPVITVTQNSKASENSMQTLDNSQIGDSYKKVRNADTILMLRQEQDKSITDQAVFKDVFDPSYNMANLTTLDYFSALIPMTLKLTKAKEGSKNSNRYHIFNPLNLRIYESFTTLAEDMEQYKPNNDELIRDIESIGLSINEDFIYSIDTDEIENLIL